MSLLSEEQLDTLEKHEREKMPTVSKQKTKKTPVKKKPAKKTKAKTTRKKSGGVLGRVQPMGFNENEGICINAYGRSGTGKTTLWGTFPGPTLAIIASGGSNPGELRSINTAENRKKIQTVTLEKPSEVRELVEWQRSEGKFQTVVLDHASGLQDLCVQEVGGLSEAPVQMSWGIISQSQWGQVAVMMKMLLRNLIDLTCNRVIVAQERAFNTDSEDSIVMPYVASALSPSVVGWLNPACDYIVETFIRPKTKTVKKKRGGKLRSVTVDLPGVEYCLRTAPDAVYTTKFRVPKGTNLPEVIVDPSYEKIMELINQGD